MTDAGTLVTTGIDKAVSNVHYGLDKTIGKGGLFIAKKVGNVLSKSEDQSDTETAEQTTASERVTKADRFQTMGQGGQGLQKGATMAGVKKTMAGTGGKRRLRKIRGGSSGARL